MSETINVRGPEYFREQAEREYLRQRVKIVEKKLEEQMEQSVPEAIDKMLSGMFGNKKIDIQVKL